ncbi:helix-turn-helix transcriptional regulator [Polaromonas sp. YR568]|uniref:AraC family transcriptional regulator n=1 Tax=Polaromonas sp. YR568 TaxID=1855301 RepID=UPI003137F267
MSDPNRQQTSPTRQNFGSWATLAKAHRAGSTLSRHQHRAGQLVFALSGVMLVETSFARWTVPPQRALWVPPHHPHAIQMISDTEMRTVYCQPVLIEQCKTFVRRDEVHAVIASPLIRELVLGLFDDRFDPPALQLMVSLLLHTLQQTPSLPTQLPMPANEALRRAAVLLLQTQHWQLPLHHLASEAAMSERTFTRRFTAEMGLSFRAWRQRARIISSLSLLATGRPVKTIAHMLQFESAAAYAASFREVLGTTPNAYRLRRLGAHSMPPE